MARQTGQGDFREGRGLLESCHLAKPFADAVVATTTFGGARVKRGPARRGLARRVSLDLLSSGPRNADDHGVA